MYTIYEKLDDLRIDLEVGLKVVPSTFLRAFGDSGIKRKRDDVATGEIAQRLAKHISWVHKCYEGQRRVVTEDLAEFLFQHLAAVPNDVARNLTAKKLDERSSAESTIVATLIDALTANWELKYEPGNPSLPGQGVKWHSPQSPNE